jgi:hypothetical protein
MNGAVKVNTLALLSLLLSIAHANTVTTTNAQGATTTVECDRFRKTGFWDVDIDNFPALSPLCGPPISVNALRDKSKLPAQICGVVGSYILCLVLVGFFLLTVGRRIRRNTETLSAREIEMVNPGKHFEPGSPAASQKSWIKNFSRLKVTSSNTSKASSNPGSPRSFQSPGHAPGHESYVSFDSKVLQTDHERRQAEMDRLYAAVREHEEAKRASEVRVSQVSSMRSGQQTVEGSPPKRGGLRVQIAETAEEHQVPHPTKSPSLAPKSPYKAIYPPYPSPGGLSTTSGQSPMSPMEPMTPLSAGVQQVQLPDDMYPASPPPQNRQMQLPSSNEPPPTPRSFLRRQSRDEKRDPSISSTGSSSKSRKLGLKNIRIGGPVPNDDNDEREPLTPRYYNPPSPPSPPMQADHRVRFEQPPTPHTGVSMESDTYAAERLDQPKPLPTAQPQRRPSNLQLGSLPANPSATKSASSSTNTLPLRAFQNASTSEISLAPSNPLSPGPIKTTFLERKPMNRGPLTARTPRTGVPQTPYSAYMPFTPMTPVTPGLVSKKERKERIKAEGRKVLVEEDLVKDGDDMWDM